MALLFNTISSLIRLAELAICVYCVLTWVAPRSSLRYTLARLIEPLCAPFRALSDAVVSRWGSPFDLTCLFSLIGLNILRRILFVLYRFLRFL